jgi:hypothetical protein
LKIGFRDPALQIPSAILKQDSGLSETGELVFEVGTERREQDWLAVASWLKFRFSL